MINDGGRHKEDISLFKRLYTTIINIIRGVRQNRLAPHLIEHIGFNKEAFIETLFI